jgi:hypothetical protein
MAENISLPISLQAGVCMQYFNPSPWHYFLLTVFAEYLQ